jgi:DNA-binding GntR family transcriptional regulator
LQLWETVLERVRAAIVAGEVPAGAKLIETELAERFGTSRGPIRQAIRELAREGLVVELPRRRAFVATLTARDLVEVYAVREALESGAMRGAVADASDAEMSGLESSLTALEEGWDRGVDYLQSATHDLQFHRELVALRRNARMAAMYEQMLGQTVLLLRSAAESSPTLSEGMPRSVHRDIFDALVARSPERAGAAIARHYRHAEERLFGKLGGDSR